MRRIDRIAAGRDAVSSWQRVPAISLSRDWEEEQKGKEKRKQEKGNASQALLCDCLHIVFSRDIARAARDRQIQNDGNPPFLASNREIVGALGGAR